MEANLNETFEALESIKGGNEQRGEIEPLKVQELKALIGVIENQKGELVCKSSFPSMPLFFGTIMIIKIF